MKHPCISQMAPKREKQYQNSKKIAKNLFWHISWESRMYFPHFRSGFTRPLLLHSPKIGNREKMHLYNLIKKFYYRFHLSVRKEFSAMALKSGLQGNIKSHQCTVGLNWLFCSLRDSNLGLLSYYELCSLVKGCGFESQWEGTFF